MATIFREIGKLSVWDGHRGPDEQWLQPGDVRADAVGKLKAKDNKLSVFFVDQATDVRRIAVAYAATRDDVKEVVYCLVDDSHLALAQIDISKSACNVPDELVSSWHADMLHLTAPKLAEVARVLQHHGTFGSLLPVDVGKLINRHVAIGLIKNEHLNEKLKGRLAAPKYQP